MRTAAAPWLSPGDTGLRSDVTTLADAGVLGAPITAWPVPRGDILVDLRNVNAAELNGPALLALERATKFAAAGGP